MSQYGAYEVRIWSLVPRYRGLLPYSQDVTVNGGRIY